MVTHAVSAGVAPIVTLQALPPRRSILVEHVCFYVVVHSSGWLPE